MKDLMHMGGGRPVALVLALLVAAAAMMQSRAWLERDVTVAVANAELIYLPPTQFLRVVSLRYGRVLADVLWFRTISYFGHHYRGDGAYPWLARMCDAVTDLDPQAEHAYSFCGVLLPCVA